MKPSLMCSAVLAIAGLSACAHYDAIDTDVEDPTKTDTTLTEYHWTMNRAVDPSGNTDPQWIYNSPGSAPVTLTFDQHRLAITGLCNSMGASYTTDGTQINISQVAGTMMMCPDQTLMQYERAFGQRLTQASSWGITRMHDEPVEHPSLTLRFTDGAQWVLTGSPTPETQYGSTGETVFLEVAPDTVPCADSQLPQRQCLNVRTVSYDANGLRQGHGPWEPFYGHIDNYEHTPGVRNVLRVKRYTRSDAPAGVSPYVYMLDMVVEADRSGV